jgi:outer membrane protein TolC
MKAFFLLIICQFVLVTPYAQVLTLKEFLKTVYVNHPDAIQAGLLMEEAYAAQKFAKGAFDPRIFAHNHEKVFGGTHYYSRVEAGISMPLNPGIDLKGGYNLASGLYLNPDQKIPAAGLGSFGLDLNLGKGLFFDQRRFDLKNSDLQISFNEALRLRFLNDLILEASASYFNWTFQYNSILAYRQAVELAKVRFEAVKESYVYGDMAAADTLEAYLEYQNRLNLLTFAEINFQNSTLDVNSFYWDDDQTVKRLDSGYLPENSPGEVFYSFPVQSSLTEFILQNHPELLEVSVKRAQIDLERKLALEGFKPEVQLKYRYLLNDQQIPDATNPLAENMNWGVNFSFPLFLRQARGKMDGILIKRMQNDLKGISKLNELSFKMEAFFAERENLEKQLDLVRDVVKNHERLVQIENRKFEIGESSLFLINNRESRLIDAKINLAKIEYQIGIIDFKMLWAIGKLSEVVAQF